MPTINEGKKFEQLFAMAVKKAKQGQVYLHRLRDTDSSYRHTETSKYTKSNECDYFMYYNGLLYALELKSTKYKSIGFELDETKEDKMIKRNQIKSLTKLDWYDGIVAGLVLNFRDESNPANERTYFMYISDFNRFCNSVEKKSINEGDIVQYGGFPIPTTLQRVRCTYDIEQLIDKVEQQRRGDRK